MTLRTRDEIVSLRRRTLFSAVRDALIAASSDAFHVVHYSVQIDHIHLIIEADDRETLIRGAQGLAIRVAKAVNKALGRGGRVWGYHFRELATPREVRNAIAYVLLNFRHHLRFAKGIDECSSGAWFDGWLDRPPVPNSPLPSPRTWLLSIGWRRRGHLPSLPRLRLESLPPPGIVHFEISRSKTAAAPFCTDAPSHHGSVVGVQSSS